MKNIINIRCELQCASETISPRRKNEKMNKFGPIEAVMKAENRERL